eukprot:10403852-Alexandrium_andersonii.AAC.1
MPPSTEALQSPLEAASRRAPYLHTAANCCKRSHRGGGPPPPGLPRKMFPAYSGGTFRGV